MLFSVFIADTGKPLDEHHISKKKSHSEEGKNGEKDISIYNKYKFWTEKQKGKLGIMNLLEVLRLTVNLH